MCNRELDDMNTQKKTIFDIVGLSDLRKLKEVVIIWALECSTVCQSWSHIDSIRISKKILKIYLCETVLYDICEFVTF